LADTFGAVAVLPPAATEEAFAAIRQDEAALRPGIERLCRHIGVDTSRLARYVAGSRPVYAAGELVACCRRAGRHRYQ
jgi:hygromycin-B 7''-O-kinase